MGSHNNQTTVPEKTPQEIEAEKQAAAKLAADKALEDQKKQQADANAEQGGLGGLLSGVLQMIMKLIQTIFGAFSDTKSEYSEIDEQDAQKPTIIGTAKERVDGFLKTVGNAKLTELAKKYEGKKLENISPFQTETVVTSGLGHRDIGGNASKDHKGLDLAPVAANGETRIYNTMPGVVVRSETQYNKQGKISGFGHWVEVACIDGTRRRYAHLKQQGVPVGTILEQGSEIGIMGNSGTSVGPTGMHLHYEWRDKDGKLLEPEINGVHYARNDKSYLRSHVAADDGKYAVADVHEHGGHNLPGKSKTGAYKGA